LVPQTWTAEGNSRLMHARKLFPIELLKKSFFSKIQGSYVPYLVKIGP